MLALAPPRRLGFELLHDEGVRAVEILESRELVVLDLDLVVPLDGSHDFDTHHRVDAQLLECRAVRNRVLLRNLGDEGSQLLFQVPFRHGSILLIQTTHSSTTSRRSRMVFSPVSISSGI